MDKKPKIRFVLIKLERALVLQILEMDERFRNNILSNAAYSYNTSGMKVKSVVYPSIGTQPDEVYLRGTNRTFDLSPTAKEFESNADRDAYYDKIVNALKHWSEEWIGFKEEVDTPVVTPPSNNEFTFY